jgi:LPS-assembly protein
VAQDLHRPAGQSWTPFGSFRGDLAFASLNTAGAFNQFLPNFLDTSGDAIVRAMPAAGITYRYPFLAETSIGSHVIEPIAQFIARPKETQIGRLPNEDAQSLTYDDTNLFEVSKFSGYDRVEGGSRANVGAQYTFTAAQGAFVSALLGQSYQIGAANSYATPDIAHVGDNSGLENRVADYVGRLQIAPSSRFSFIGRARFDEQTFAMKRVELQASAAVTDKLSASLIYARYAPQPELGYYVRREGLVASAQYFVTDNWYVNGSALFDLSRNAQEKFYQLTGGQSSNALTMASMQMGAGYRDECTTIAFVYGNSGKLTLTDGTRERVQTFMVRLELRTLGGAKYSYNQTSVATPDGLSQ